MVRCKGGAFYKSDFGCIFRRVSLDHFFRVGARAEDVQGAYLLRNHFGGLAWCWGMVWRVNVVYTRRMHGICVV